MARSLAGRHVAYIRHYFVELRISFSNGIILSEHQELPLFIDTQDASGIVGEDANVENPFISVYFFSEIAPKSTGTPRSS
jgi:hypothetical protein